MKVSDLGLISRRDRAVDRDGVSAGCQLEVCYWPSLLRAIELASGAQERAEPTTTREVRTAFEPRLAAAATAHASNIHRQDYSMIDRHRDGSS
jgi:hypothetical protein